MTMVSSGEISIGGSATSGGLNRSINIELGRSATATSSLNETSLRNLAGVASGTISLSNFYGKSNFTVSNPITGLSGTYDDDGTGQGYAGTTLQIGTNGTYTIDGIWSGNLKTGNWGSPTTTGIGSNYWVRFTRTAFTQSNGSATATTGWLQLSSARSVSSSCSNPSGNAFANATYTVEISTDSAGTTIVSTTTGVILTCSSTI